MDRVCIFIDGSNFYHALKGAGWPTSVDFEKLAYALTGKQRQHKHTYYYNTPLVFPKSGTPGFDKLKQQHRAQQGFFSALKFIPDLTFRKGRFQKLPGGKQVEKGVDVALAVDMLGLAFKDRYDVAILVSSDADYKYAVEAVRNETGKTVELHQIQGSKAHNLIAVCNSYRYITEETIRECLHN